MPVAAHSRIYIKKSWIKTRADSVCEQCRKITFIDYAVITLLFISVNVAIHCVDGAAGE